MPILGSHLDLDRCAHCGVHRPLLTRISKISTLDRTQLVKKWWGFYACSSCGGVTTAWAWKNNDAVIHLFPSMAEVDEALPARAKEYLKQAIGSIHSPVGAVILAASSVDAMLKENGLTEGTLYDRINKAATEHRITSEMAEWAHEVRIGANDQRHADDSAPLPTQEDAERSVNFAMALGAFLFTLPAMVQRGRKNAKDQRPEEEIRL